LQRQWLSAPFGLWDLWLSARKEQDSCCQLREIIAVELRFMAGCYNFVDEFGINHI